MRLKNDIKLKRDGKTSMVKYLKNYTTTFCYGPLKRFHFRERPYKGVNCVEVFGRPTSLKSHYMLYKQNFCLHGQYDSAS